MMKEERKIIDYDLMGRPIYDKKKERQRRTKENKNVLYIHIERETDETLDITEIKVINIKKLEIIKTFNNYDELMSYLISKTHSVVEAVIHDININGAFLPYYLRDNGFKNIPLTGKKETQPTMSYIKIMSNALTYSYKIRENNKKLLTINDSSKLINMDIQTIRKKAEIPQDIPDYMIIPTYLKRFYEQGHANITIGSCAFKEFLELEFKGNRNKFKNLFPNVSLETNRYFQESYKGGFCYVAPQIKNKELYRNGVTIDVNSLYPSVMLNSILPYGEPVYFEGKYKNIDGLHPLYLQKVRLRNAMLKPKHVPCIQKPNATGYYEYVEQIELILTDKELELVLNSYYIENIEYVDGYQFRGCKGMFNKYIKKFGDMKKTATNPVDRLIAKLFLNSLSGKFGTKVERNVIYVDFDENGIEIKRETPETYTTPMYYTPMVSFITSYARCITITGANMNYDNYCYADTDSLHLLGSVEDIKGLVLDDKELGAWKVETIWNKAKFLGLKKYMEYNINSNKWDVKCCGLPKDIQEEAITNMEDLAYNKEFYKKTLTRVKGGAVMMQQKYTILPDADYQKEEEEEEENSISLEDII